MFPTIFSLACEGLGSRAAEGSGIICVAIVGGAIVSEAFISYLGFGVNPATPTWGNILSESAKFLQQGNWWWIGFPGLFIVLTSLSVNMIGDALRAALDPRGVK